MIVLSLHDQVYSPLGRELLRERRIVTTQDDHRQRQETPVWMKLVSAKSCATIPRVLPLRRAGHSPERQATERRVWMVRRIQGILCRQGDAQPVHPEDRERGRALAPTAPVCRSWSWPRGRDHRREHHVHVERHAFRGVPASEGAGAIINLDDISHLRYVEEHAGGLPELIAFATTRDRCAGATRSSATRRRAGQAGSVHIACAPLSFMCRFEFASIRA